MFKGISYSESMMILVYPNNQREIPDLFLNPPDFKKPQELIGTYCTEIEKVWQDAKQTLVRETRTPNLVKQFELITRSPDVENYFLSILEEFKEFTEGINISQILKLYCVFDEIIANTPKEELIVEERIGQNYLDDSEKLAS